MKNISIPETAEEYQDDLMERMFPDERIANNDFYRRMIGWVIDNRTPLLYEQSHPEEYANLSINFNWLLARDYTDTKLGPPPTMQSLYALHEFTHMTNWLPTRLGEISMGEYADQFTRSEYRASNESEILVHYRVPELRQTVFQGMTIAFDLMKQRNITQPSSALLGKVRALIIEHDLVDDQAGLIGDDPAVRQELARLKQFNGNREWAGNHFQAIRGLFLDPTLPLGDGLTDTEYEPAITAYEPGLSQEQYESNAIRNVRLAHGMCGLPIPKFSSFGEAVVAARELEGRDALV
jgi:hypothetical protein